MFYYIYIYNSYEWKYNSTRVWYDRQTMLTVFHVFIRLVPGVVIFFKVTGLYIYIYKLLLIYSQNRHRTLSAVLIDV